MRYLAGTLSILTLLALGSDVASAQGRTGRATGSTGTATGSARGSTTGSATGIGSRTTGRLSPASRGQAADVIRGRTEAIDRARTAATRSPRTGSIGGTPIGGRTAATRSPRTGSIGGTAIGGRTATIGGGGTMVRVGPDRRSSDRTAVRSGEPRIGDVRGASDRVIRGSADGVIRGGAVGTRRYDRGSGWGVRSGPYYGSGSHGRHVVIDPWYQTRFRACPVSFVFGRHGLTCFHSFAGARFILPVPFFFIYPLAVVHIQSSSSYGASTVVHSGYPVETESPGCAVVTVVLPGNDGYWKTLRLPIENAYTRDDLRRLLSDRMRAGVAFTVVDADGVRLEIPAGLQINEVLVEPCR